MHGQTAKRLLWIFFGALLTAAPLIFPQIGFFSWFGMIPLIYGAICVCSRAECTRRAAFGSGFFAGFVFYFAVFHWLVSLYPLDSVGMSKGGAIAVIAAGWIGVPALYGILSGVLFLLFRTMHKTGIFAKVPLLRPFAFAALWTGYEWLTSQTWMGVPWGRLALGQVDMRPMLWISSVFGGYAVTFLIVAVNALIVEAGISPKKTVVCGVLAAALFAGNLGCGLIWLNRETPTGTEIKAAVLQANIGMEKWNGANDMEIHVAWTKKAAAEGAQLIVWPETALTYAPDEIDRQELAALSRSLNVDLVVGGLYFDEAGNQYNALYYVDHEKGFSETVYLKRHLVPFGEYVPWRSLFETLIPPLADLSFLEDLSAGTSSALFDGAWGKIGSLICFDSIYDQLAGESMRDGAELLVISSNDAWFSDSAGVYQHNAQAVLRAVESGKWVLRSANTGISSVITPDGLVVDSLPPLTEGDLVQTVQFVSGQTVYSRIGNLFVYLCLAFSAGVLVAGWVVKRKRAKTN